MPRLIVGGYGRDTVMHFQDEVCRAAQHVLIRRLASGNGMFLRSSRIEEGKSTTTVIWIPSSGSVRFEYDDDTLPELNEELVATYWAAIESGGGLVLPSQAEVDSWRLEDEAESAIVSGHDNPVRSLD